MNFFDTHILKAVIQEITPKKTFFRDRYFPTLAGDIFASDKVLCEYRKGDNKLAAFVSDRIGDIPVERRGYSVWEYQPAKIAPSRLLTLDDLKKRGFGEAMYANLDTQKRAARLIADDMIDLDARIARREEWMAVQTMINNACTMQTMVDGTTQGEQQYVQFYDQSSEHTYTVPHTWDDASGNFIKDVTAMCRMLSKRGLKAADLILGTDAADVVMGLSKVKDMIKKDSGYNFGMFDQTLLEYDGVAYMGTFNFGGFRLNLISVDEQYTAADGTATSYFPAKSAMVTAPNCGHTMYGQVTQIDYGSADFAMHTGKRIPKFVVDQDKDVRKFRITSRPLVAPLNYCPYIYAANVVS